MASKAMARPIRYSVCSGDPCDQGEKLTETEMGSFMHASEGEMVCESTNVKIPFFNAPMYLENKVGTPLQEIYQALMADRHK